MSSTRNGAPFNMYLLNKRRIGANTKDTVRDPQTITRQGVVAANIRPLYNNDPGLSAYPKTFRAIPYKHYRKQYADSSNRNRATAPRDLLRNSLAPGGVSATSTECSSCSTFGMPIDEMTYNVDISNAELNQRNRCYITDAKNARTRARGAKTNINSNPNKPKYYTDTRSYLHSRVRTYDQRKFNFSDTVSHTIKPGTADASNYTYRANSCCNKKCQTWETDTSSSCNTTCSNFSDVSGAVVYYKPSNPKYAEQGAVSSSNRILRHKVDSITKAANNADESGNLFKLGNNIANAVAYSSRTETPFTAKSKFQLTTINNRPFRPALSNLSGYRRRNAPMRSPCPTCND